MLEMRTAGGDPARRPKLQAVVTGVTNKQVVQFDFVYGDPDLTVELVLPIPAFRDFCTDNRCLVTAADPAESATVLRMFSGSPAHVHPVGAH